MRLKWQLNTTKHLCRLENAQKWGFNLFKRQRKELFGNGSAFSLTTSKQFCSNTCTYSNIYCLSSEQQNSFAKKDLPSLLYRRLARGRIVFQSRAFQFGFSEIPVREMAVRHAIMSSRISYIRPFLCSKRFSTYLWTVLLLNTLNSPKYQHL